MRLLIFLCFFIQDDFQKIDAHVEDIQSGLSRFTESEAIDLSSQASEILEASSVLNLSRVKLIHHKEKTELRRIHIMIEGVKQDINSYYYFTDDGLCFVRKFQKDYEFYKTDDDFDSSKYTESVNSYYIKDSKLIRWINDKNVVVESPLVIMMAHQNIILNDEKVYTLNVK